MNEEIKWMVSEFFDKLPVEIDSLETIIDDESNNIINIKLKTEDSGVIIWPHGKNLDAIQNILKLMIAKKVWDKVRLHLEVNDYVETKDERLFSFIKSKIEQLRRTKEDICLPFYTAYERKKIHGFVSEQNFDNIYTKSIWEWRDRRMHLCIQKEKLSIDIDWDSI